MRLTRTAVAVLSAVALCTIGAVPAGADTEAAFTVQDKRITEASGIAVGSVTPDVLYVQNDSGDSARFFALDRRTGETRAEIDVPDAKNRDWEDIAVAPDNDGRSAVWLADIGDNGEDRDSVQVYRVDEPRLGAAPNQKVTAAGLRRYDLRYPDGPHNAEGFTVDPVHRFMYVVTKSATNPMKVFRAPLVWSASVITFEEVRGISLPRRGLLGSANVVTGAAYSPRSKLFVVRTYVGGYYWHVPDGDIVSALASPPSGLDLPVMPQSEGIAIDGSDVWVNSEGTGERVYRVRIPSTDSVTSTASGTPDGAEVSPVSSRATRRNRQLVVIGAVLGVGVVLATAVRMAHARRRS
jgi:hypothetical protein